MLEFEFQFCRLLAVYPWESYYPVLNLSFHICQMSIKSFLSNRGLWLLNEVMHEKYPVNCWHVVNAHQLLVLEFTVKSTAWVPESWGQLLRGKKELTRVEFDLPLISLLVRTWTRTWKVALGRWFFRANMQNMCSGFKREFCPAQRTFRISKRGNWGDKGWLMLFMEAVLTAQQRALQREEEGCEGSLKGGWKSGHRMSLCGREWANHTTWSG